MKIMHIKQLSPDMTVTQASKYRNIEVLRNQLSYLLLHQMMVPFDHRNFH